MEFFLMDFHCPDNSLMTIFCSHFIQHFNRFSPTRAPSPWNGIRIADKFSPVCPQRLPNIQNETGALEKMPKGRLEYLKRLLPFLQNQSEDCLYLNIFSPAAGMCILFIRIYLFRFLLFFVFVFVFRTLSIVITIHECPNIYDDILNGFLLLLLLTVVSQQNDIWPFCER